jgi:hypothetical protein
VCVAFGELVVIQTPAGTMTMPELSDAGDVGRCGWPS